MTDTLDAITANIQSYLVAPLNAFGIGGFLFDVAGESVATLTAEITDHYTEDNRALQDHIAIHPKKITLKGYVGELIYSTASADNQFLESAVQKLTTISSFLPTLSAAATQIQQTIQAPSDSTVTLSQAANIYGLVQNILGAQGDQARQQNAYNYFKALMTEGILMGIQTPWEFMTNMAIENITAVQPESSIFMTDFAVTFKEVRIAQTSTTAYSAGDTGGVTSLNGMSMQGASADQAALQNPLGNVPGVSLPTTLVPGAQSKMITASSMHSVAGVGNLFSLEGV